MTVSLLASKSDPGAEADAGATRGMTAAPLLSVSGLSVSYGRLRALDDINLDVRSGELIALAGEHGAGRPPWCAASPGTWSRRRARSSSRASGSRRIQPARPSTGWPWSG